MKFLKFFVCIIMAACMCMAAACAGGSTTDGGVTDNGTTNNSSADDGTTDGGKSDDGTTDGGKSDDGATDDGSTDESPSGNEEEDDVTIDVGDLLESLDEVIDALLDRPDPFSFLPEAFDEENLAYNSVQTEDFSKFVSTSSMLTVFTGRQMHVVQGVLSRSSAILSGADMVFTAGEVIAQAYRSFIDDNPDDSDEFSTTLTIAGSEFAVSISVSDTAASLSASNGTISVTLNSDTSASAQWRNSGIIQLGDSSVLKYGFSDDSLSLALKFTVSSVSYMQYLSFERENGVVSGKLTEFIGTASVNTKTSALIYSDDEITAVISNKREDEDLSINSFAEVYSSVNGRYLAGEVTETVLTADYDTIWVPLSSVEGITSVCVTDEENADNKLNSNSVYINGSSTPLVPEYNSVALVRTSRHYDIELRTVWYYVLTADGVEEREVQIPMLFVQRENVEDFTAEMYDNNEVYATLPSEDISRVNQFFDSYSAAFEEYKEQITYSWLNNYIENL